MFVHHLTKTGEVFLERKVNVCTIFLPDMDCVRRFKFGDSSTLRSTRDAVAVNSSNRISSRKI